MNALAVLGAALVLSAISGPESPPLANGAVKSFPLIVERPPVWSVDVPFRGFEFAHNTGPDNVRIHERRFEIGQRLFGNASGLGGGGSGVARENQGTNDEDDADEADPKLPTGPMGGFVLGIRRLPFLTKLGVFAGLGGLAAGLVNADAWWRNRPRYGSAIGWGAGLACYGFAVWLAMNMTP